MRLAVISGGKSAIDTWRRKDSHNYGCRVYINAGRMLGSCMPNDIYAFKDTLMIRKNRGLIAHREVWTNAENKDLVTGLGGTYTTDLSKHGYNYTATATLFEVYNQFRFVDCVDLFGFDMVDGSAISKHSAEGHERWASEGKEFRAILKQFDAGGLKYRHIKTLEDLKD